MKVFCQILTLCLVLSLSFTAPEIDDHMTADHHVEHHVKKINLCDGVEFDAMFTERGLVYFMKDDYLTGSFHHSAYKGNLMHVDRTDAVFHMHNPADPSSHDHTFYFRNDTVFCFYKDRLVEGYPKDISEVFPGIPHHMDAAVECPKGECVSDSVLFFKGNEAFAFDLKSKTVQKRNWTHLPRCTSALRWLERYYCFHGYNFTRFHPVTGAVVGKYPKDSRKYFMHCPVNNRNDTQRERCSHQRLDAVTTDDLEKAYAFRGNFYLRVNYRNDDRWLAFRINDTWKEIKGNVEAVFSYHGKVYFIKDEQVYIYNKSGAKYTLMEGYPKPLKEELGIDGPVNAAFVCKEHEIVHVIKDQKMYKVDLSVMPRKVQSELSVPFSTIDAATCGPDGVKVFVGPHFFNYESPKLFALSHIKPRPQNISTELLGCDQ